MSNTNANLPRPDSPIMLPDGRMSPEWWSFFLALFNRTGGAGSPIDINSLHKQDEISQDVPPQNAATMAALQGVQDLWSEQRAPENLSQILARLDALESSIPTQADLMQLMRRIDEREAEDIDLQNLTRFALLSGANFGGPVSAPKFQTATATVASVASGAATTIYTFPNTAPAAWLVHANFNFTSNDTGNYSAFAVVISDGSAARIALSNNATLMSIGLSGLNIQVTQSSGGAQPVVVTVTKVG